MNSIEKFLAPKTLTLIHTIVSFVLIIVLFFLSFGTIFTLDVASDKEMLSEINGFVDDIEEETGENLDIEIPEKVNVSFPFIVKSAIGGIKAVGVIIDVAKDAAEDVKSDIEDAQNTKDQIDDMMNDPSSVDEEELNDLLEKATEPEKKKTEHNLSEIFNQDVVNLVCLIVAILTAFAASPIAGICYALILGVVIVVPISCIFNAILCIVSMIKNAKEPGKAFHRVAKSFSAIIKKFPLILLILVLVPEVKVAGALIGMFIAVIVGLVISLAVSRLKAYEKPDFKYLNVLQICSLASLVAFLVFFFNMAKTHIMDAFFTNTGKYIANEAVGAITQKAKIDFIPLVLITVFVIVLLMVCNYLVKIVTRLACMSSSKSDAHFFVTIAGLALVVIPFVLMNTDFKLELADAEMSAFIVSAVGIVLMLVAEIVLKVLDVTLCKDVPSERRKEIVTGAYIHESHREAAETEEAVAEETAVEEEAVAEETVAEETETEEVAEEAAAEETVAEEAVEETVAETETEEVQ